MTYRCLRCDFQGDDAAAGQHATDAGHPRCTVCSVSLDLHRKQVCPRCVARACADLADIEDRYARLNAELGNLRAPLPGSSGAAGFESPLPGGDVLTLLAPGSRGLSQLRGVRTPAGWDDSHGADEYDGDPQSAAFELSRWEDDWRLTRGEPAATSRATVSGAKAYLNRNLDWAANGDVNHPTHPGPHPSVDEFCSDLRRLLARLQRATFTDDTPIRGVDCFECGAILQRSWTVSGLQDDWTCPRCRRVYTPAEHTLAVRARMEDHLTRPDALLTATEIRGRITVSENQLRMWQKRDKLQSQGRDDRGRNLYRWGDVKALVEKRGDRAASA